MPYNAIVRTGRKKFSNVAASAACVAVPLNHFRPKADDANTVIKITPDTYSGVAVVVMAKDDRLRSSFDPSFIPAKTPIIKADGTINTMTQNMSFPVNPKRVLTISETSALNTLENPHSP